MLHYVIAIFPFKDKISRKKKHLLQVFLQVYVVFGLTCKSMAVGILCVGVGVWVGDYL